MRLPIALLVTAAVAAGLVACGGGDDEGALPPSADTKTIALEKGKFDPRAIYDRAAPGVVTVISLLGAQDALGAPQGAQGSGFVLSDEGEIATNAHVVTEGEGNDISRASEVFIDFPDGNRVPAKVVGFDPFYDVALLKVDPDGLKLAPLELESAGVGVGEPVAAIGSPFGEEQSLSVGVVSATDRSVKSLTDFTIDGAIQTDAAINSGNSGGPLLGADARVIGINQQIASSSGGSVGIGFAVPVAAVRRSLEQLRDDGEAEYAYLGVSTEQMYPQLAGELNLDTKTGALIADVVEGGPAAKAGLRGGNRTIRFQGGRVRVGGDVILAVDGKQLIRASDLARLISAKRPGDEVELRVLRGSDERDVTVTLGRRPATT